MTDTFLLNDFYTIEDINEKDDHGFLATILLNASHPVFIGHFEQMPVVPGVFQTQLIKELLQQHLQKNLQLLTGNNIKFLGMILPDKHLRIRLELSYRNEEEKNKYITDAKLFYENTTFTKFKGIFISL